MESGKLLVADPSVFGDQNFHRSIVIMAHQKDSGSLGFILNKPLDYELNDVLPEIKLDFPLYYGGPVEQDNLFFIHNAGHLVPESIRIDEKLFWGGDFEKIIVLVNEGVLTRKDIRFFLGYSGWSEEQLEQEISAHSWVVIQNPLAGKILSCKSQDLWKDQMVALGGKYLLWSNTPENPSHN
ncbi:MAG: YqgE/AlgH family protein [Bacteroidetes bacterium]|nr:YqgE/AlgH family protein [Bacteroidota bacterium]